MLSTCGKGCDATNGLVKVMGFICVNAAVPTVTVTGMVVLSPAVWKTSCPVKVPATSPPLGRFAAVTEIVAMEGAVPLVGVAVSHAPPSAVLVVTVQFSVPVPPLPICTICEVAAPPVLKENLNAPGRLSKNAPLATIVRFTGTTIDRPGLAYSVKIISAV